MTSLLAAFLGRDDRPSTLDEDDDEKEYYHDLQDELDPGLPFAPCYGSDTFVEEADDVHDHDRPATTALMATMTKMAEAGIAGTGAGTTTPTIDPVTQRDANHARALTTTTTTPAPTIVTPPAQPKQQRRGRSRTPRGGTNSDTNEGKGGGGNMHNDIVVPKPPPMTWKQLQSGGVDYDEGPTSLYKLLEIRDWYAAEDTLESDPKQATIWIYRLDPSSPPPPPPSTTSADNSCSGGDASSSMFSFLFWDDTPAATPSTPKIRWRLLPLHAALIFDCPSSTVKALIRAYPDSVKAKDDAGHLPLHLAMRGGASKDVIKCLRMSYPDAVNVRDKRGLVPAEGVDD